MNYEIHIENLGAIKEADFIITFKTFPMLIRLTIYQAQ